METLRYYKRPESNLKDRAEIEFLQGKVVDQQKEMDLLKDCILEMSEAVYA